MVQSCLRLRKLDIPHPGRAQSVLTGGSGAVFLLYSTSSWLYGGVGKAPRRPAEGPARPRIRPVRARDRTSRVERDTGCVVRSTPWRRRQARTHREPWERRIVTIRKLRCVVGVHILYALELMIVSDIIESFIAVAAAEADGVGFFESDVFFALMKLGFIVLIRTVIDYFLGKEISELGAESS